MNDEPQQQPGQKREKSKRPQPPIGSISSFNTYATIGGKTKHSDVQPSEQLEVQQSTLPDVQTSKEVDTQMSKVSDVQPSEQLEVQQSTLPETQMSKLVDAQISKGSDVRPSSISESEQSSMPNTKKSSKHPGWKQQTFYLPAALAKRLRHRATEEERELSEIAADAIQAYLQSRESTE